MLFLKVPQNSRINTRPETYRSIKSETPAQVFPRKFREIFKSTYFGEHLRMAASEINDLKTSVAG